MPLFYARQAVTSLGTADNVDIGIPQGEFVVENINMAITGTAAAAASIAIGRNGSFTLLKAGLLDPSMNSFGGFQYHGPVRVRGGDIIRGNFRRVPTTETEVLEVLYRPVMPNE